MELLRSRGIAPFLLDFQQNPLSPELLDADAIVITLPPGKAGSSQHYETALRTLASQAPASVKWIFCSSTSVYPELNGVVTEEDASPECLTRSAVSLLKMESVFQSSNTTVIRLAGLIGPGRHPGGFFSRKGVQKGGNAPVNLVHQSDAVDAITWILEKGLWREVYNVCSPEHPQKGEYYTRMARQIGLDPPAFSDENTDWKIVSSDKLVKTGFEFRSGVANI